MEEPFDIDEKDIERFYVSDFEREYSNGEWRDICYIHLPSGDMALYIEPHGSGGDVFFAYQDYQGTILAIADDNGGIVEEYSYDAWGNRRDESTLDNNYYPTGGNGVWQGFFHRGYTGHEHLECFGLINMNGRLYDPLLGRMLSPDKYVQAPDFSQNFNRYSYAWNNPLTYTDPSGDIVFIAAGALIGAYIGGAIQSQNFNILSEDYWKDGWQGFLGGAVVGGVTGFGGGAMIGKGVVSKKTGSALLSKTGGKQLFSSMVSGTVNTINNYDPSEGFGWHSLGHFTAGALGGLASAHPMGGGLFGGMWVGGVLNSLVNMPNHYNDGADYDKYVFFQYFLGGALSVAVGAGFAKSGDLGFLKTGTKAWKTTKKGLWYGGQNMAADFAYTDREYYKFASWRTVGMFGAGAIGGIGQDYLANTLEVNTKIGWVNDVSNSFLRYGGGTGAALTADMTLTFLAKGGYSNFYRKGRETKTGYIMYKTLLYTGFHRN